MTDETKDRDVERKEDQEENPPKVTIPDEEPAEPTEEPTEVPTEEEAE